MPRRKTEDWKELRYGVAFKMWFKGHSQQEVANKVGCSQGLVSNILHGKTETLNAKLKAQDYVYNRNGV